MSHRQFVRRIVHVVSCPHTRRPAAAAAVHAELLMVFGLLGAAVGELAQQRFNRTLRHSCERERGEQTVK